MGTLLHLTLTELTEALASKQASPVDLAREVFEAVDRENPTLNAIVAERDRDDVLKAARASEARIVRGEGRPLEGVLFGVKDLEDVAGLPTTHGSKLFADDVASESSVQVERLETAGAIAFCKTNAPEFGSLGLTKNLVYGATRSPWDLERTPGGSSGGSSAALAAEILPMVTASDGGGSIRGPASFVGAFGLKPSYGRIPKAPLDEWEHGATSVYGPLTKTVADAARFLDVVAGHHPRDPRSLPAPGISYRDEVERPFDGGLDLAVLGDFGHAAVQSDVAAVFDEAVGVLEALGHRIHRLDNPPPDLGVSWGMIGAFEIGGRIAATRPGRDADITRGLGSTLELTRSMAQDWWGRFSLARVKLADWCADVLSHHDFLLTPTEPYDPPPAKGPYPPETEGRAQPPAALGCFTIPFNLSWNPAATVRAGLSRAGFPVGLQIVGPHHRDDLVLRLARTFEKERPAHPHWPLRNK